MNKRTVLVGPFSCRTMQVVNEVVNIDLFLKFLPRLNLPQVWYGAIVQAGVDNIDALFPKGGFDGLPDALKRRLRYVKSGAFPSIFSLIHKCLWGVHENEIREKRMDEDACSKARVKLEAFLVELFVALSEHRNLVIFEDLPTDKLLADAGLATDVRLPLHHLFAAIKNIPMTGICTTSDFEREAIVRTEEMLGSSVYGSYLRCHEQLGDTNNPVGKARKAIEKASLRLCRRYGSLIHPKRVIGGLLTATPRLAVSVFGALPAAIIDPFAKIFGDWVLERRRLVVYQFSDILQSTMHARMDEYMGETHTAAGAALNYE